MDPLDFDHAELLRYIRLKGLSEIRSIAQAFATSESEIARRCALLGDRGLIALTSRGFRLTADGRAELASLVVQERSAIDDHAMQAAYAAFCDRNGEIKSLISAWQMRSKQDVAGNSAMIQRLLAHRRATAPLFDELVSLLPRLGQYRIRLDHAAERVALGEHDFMARPIIDSYHTVWFELHEDLLGLAGRSRAAEAEAGRAG